MADRFLEEQLARIRKLIADLDKTSRSAAGLPEELARYRESITRGPLDDVRDCRVYWSATSVEPAEPASPRESSQTSHDSEQIEGVDTLGR
jgi:hypothetical protein